MKTVTLSYFKTNITGAASEILKHLKTERKRRRQEGGRGGERDAQREKGIYRYRDKRREGRRWRERTEMRRERGIQK